MAAAIVLVFGITTAITTLQYGMRATDTARNMTLASQIMQSQMEVLRLQNWAQIIALPTPYTAAGGVTITEGNSSPATALDGTLTKIANRFTFTRTIAPILVAGVARPDIRLITLNVTWSGLDGRSHTLNYQLRYAKNGLNDYFYVSH